MWTITKLAGQLIPGLEDLKAILNKIDKQAIDLIKPNFEKVYKEIRARGNRAGTVDRGLRFSSASNNPGGRKTLVI